MVTNDRRSRRESVDSKSIGFEIDEARLIRDQSSLFARWGMDVALLSLGGVTLWLTSTLLSFDDPRPLKNAWSYLIGVPVALVSIDLVMRSLVSKFLERSIQAAFLLSILVHILMTMGAIRLVLFTEAWPELFSAIAAAPHTAEIEQLEQTSAPEYFEESITVSNAVADRAEYLKPAKTPDATAQENIADKQEVDLETASKADKSVNEPPLQEAILEAVKEHSIDIERVESEIAPPEIQSEKKNLDKPLLDSQSQIDFSEQIKPVDVPIQDQSLADSSEAMPDDSVDAPGASDGSDDRLSGRNSNVSDNRLVLNDPSQKVDSLALIPSANQQPKKMQASSTAIDRRANIPKSIDLPEVSSSIRPLTKGALSNPSESVNSGSEGMKFSPIDVPLSQKITNGEGATSGGSENGSNVSAEPAGPSDSNLDKPRQKSRTKGSANGRSGSAPSDPNSLAGEMGTLANGLNSPSTVLNRSPSSSLALNNSRGSGRRSNFDIEPSIEPPQQAAPRNIPRTNRVPSINRIRSEVAIPTPAFQKRMSRNEGDNQSPQLGDFGPETEAAIERGLEFLANFQRSDGSWHLDDFGDQPRLQSHTAASGLALLAFQGAGYSHLQYRYAPVCKSALEYLVTNQKADGDLYISMDENSDANVKFYSHAIASLALCEAYGMTQDPSIKTAAQKAVNFMAATQDPIGGGWRYQPGFESDTSVSGWYMMSLKSAQLAGLDVPEKTFQGLSKWLDQAQVSPEKRYLYRYNPFAPDNAVTRHGRKPNPTMTGVGLLMRLYMGWRRDNADMIRGADALLLNLPSEGTVDQPLRDTYYWYYATQVLFHMGGDRWQRWNASLHPLLIQSQVIEGDFIGSWSPTLPVPDRWGPFAGRLYVTTLNLLSLEVYYRHLPIYEETAR